MHLCTSVDTSVYKELPFVECLHCSRPGTKLVVQCFRSRPTKLPVRKVALAVLIPLGWSRQFSHPLWDVLGHMDRVPFRRTFWGSSLRSRSCSLCCAQGPAFLLLSKGLLSPGRGHGVQKAPCPQGRVLGLKIDSSHPFPETAPC